MTSLRRMLKAETYQAPLIIETELESEDVIASSGFDDNNNTENPFREEWDSLG